MLTTNLTSLALINEIRLISIRRLPLILINLPRNVSRTGKYGDDLNESCESVKHLWTVLSQFSSTERSRFLRFVTGRKRPPAPFTVAKAGGDKDGLPHAYTCASTLFLPTYSSAAVAKEKLRLAKYTK